MCMGTITGTTALSQRQEKPHFTVDVRNPQTKLASPTTTRDVTSTTRSPTPDLRGPTYTTRQVHQFSGTASLFDIHTLEAIWQIYKDRRESLQSTRTQTSSLCAKSLILLMYDVLARHRRRQGEPCSSLSLRPLNTGLRERTNQLELMFL